jgi:hypothetical protein
MGVIKSIKEVKDLFNQIDKGRNGLIEFEEFLDFIKFILDGKTKSPFSKLFRGLIQGTSDGQASKELSFQTLVSAIRRKKFMGKIKTFRCHLLTRLTQEVGGFAGYEKLRKNTPKLTVSDQKMISF